jgi:hypothetical protein
MKNQKQLAVWMDHSTAILMEHANGTITEKHIGADLTEEEKNHSERKGEKFVHHKEQQHASIFYKKLGEAIRPYQEVLLFGPTDAKNELLNILKADHLFDNIKFEVKNSDKMTPPQMHDVVKTHFK